MTKQDIQQLDSRYRASLINSLHGPKAPVLIGTKGTYGENLSLFNSVMHLGANPAMIAMLSRPHTVVRHTWEHILDTKNWTVNHITSDMLSQAHQASAKYEKSEFETVGLTPTYTDASKAPYVTESPIKFACSYVNHYDIVENGTIYILGQIEEVLVPEDAINEHGDIRFSSEAVSSVGLHNYYLVEHMTRLPYATPDN